MRVLFCGCIYGAGNIGDDAILGGFVSAFRKYVPSAELGAISWDPGKTKDELGLARVWGLSRKEETAAIKWATHVVLGGATLISENPNIDYPLLHNCRIIDKCLIHNKPVSLLGAGASDIHTDRARRLLKSRYEAELDIIAVRSVHDKQQAIAVGGLRGGAIQVTADAAFALPVREDCRRDPRGLVGINLVGERQVSLAFTDRISSALRDFFGAAPSYRPVGVCSETRQEKGFDYVLTRDAVRSIDPTAELWCDYLSCDTFLTLLCRCEFIVTMRMHVLLFCGLLGIPCLAIVREQKTASMLKELGLPVELHLDSTAVEIGEALSHILESPEAYIPSRERIAQLRGRAQQNADLWLDYYTGGERGRRGMSRRVGAWGRVAWGESLPMRACRRLVAIMRRRGSRGRRVGDARPRTSTKEATGT